MVRIYLHMYEYTHICVYCILVVWPYCIDLIQLKALVSIRKPFTCSWRVNVTRIFLSLLLDF
jgi:hypothetical protein